MLDAHRRGALAWRPEDRELGAQQTDFLLQRNFTSGQPCLWLHVPQVSRAIELHYPFHSNPMNGIQRRYLMMSCLLNGSRTAWLSAENYCRLEGRCACTKVPALLWKIPVIYRLCLKNEF